MHMYACTCTCLSCACLLQLGDHIGAVRRNVGNEACLVAVAQPHALSHRLLQRLLFLGQARYPVGFKVEGVVRPERLLPDGTKQRLDEIVAQQAEQMVQTRGADGADGADGAGAWAERERV